MMRLACPNLQTGIQLRQGKCRSEQVNIRAQVLRVLSDSPQQQPTQYACTPQVGQPMITSPFNIPPPLSYLTVFPHLLHTTSHNDSQTPSELTTYLLSSPTGRILHAAMREPSNGTVACIPGERLVPVNSKLRSPLNLQVALPHSRQLVQLDSVVTDNQA